MEGESRCEDGEEKEETGVLYKKRRKKNKKVGRSRKEESLTLYDIT